MALTTLQYGGHTFSVSYEILNPQARHTIVFLHGWGSNKALMKQAFGKTLDTFRHLYVDLPGFGNSTAPVSMGTEDYANVMALFLVQVGANDKALILGHSFGGKVATLLQPEVLVLAGSAGIVWPKPFKVRLKIMLFKLLKAFGLSRMRARFAAEDAKALNQIMYETFKRVVDEDFTDPFRHYDGRALLCWGRQDTATPLKSAEKIISLMPNSTLEVYEGDHYFFMQNAADVAHRIERFLTGDKT